MYGVYLVNGFLNVNGGLVLWGYFLAGISLATDSSAEIIIIAAKAFLPFNPRFFYF